MKIAPWLISVVFLASPVFLSAQVFDERMSDWPVDLKINGTIMACPDASLAAGQTDDFLAAAGGEEARIVSLQFAADDRRTLAKPDWKEAAAHVHFHMGTASAAGQDDRDDSPDPSSLREALRDATGVWITTAETLDRREMRTLETLADPLRQLLERGGVLLASGRVSQMLGKHQITGGQWFGSPRHASIRPGLDLIPDSIMQTGFDQEHGRPRLMSVLGSHPRTIGIGLDPQTGIVLRGRKIRAVGKNRAHFLIMANEHTPLRSKSIAAPPQRRSNPYEFLVDLTAWRRDAMDRTLETFPPARPQKPFVENGTLIIIGGGGMPEGLMDRFVELAGGKNARLVYVPCSERDEITGRDNRLVEAWKNAGVASAHVVHTKDRNRANHDEQFLAPLKDATGIFFGGGRQWNFADSYYGTRTHRLMKEVVTRGGVIAGSSAGASIQARYLARANPIGNFDIMAPGYERGGLGFISGVAIDQHFTQRGRQPDMSSLVNRYPQLLGIGLDERTAIVVQGSVAEVVGDGQVFFYDRGKHPAHADPDYRALKAGTRYHLATREVVE